MSMSKALYRLRFFITTNRGRILRGIDAMFEVLMDFTIFLMGSLYGFIITAVKSTEATNILHSLFVVDAVLLLITVATLLVVKKVR